MKIKLLDDFKLENYKELIEHVEAYVTGCELLGLPMRCVIHKLDIPITCYRFNIFTTRIGTIKEKSSGFNFILYNDKQFAENVKFEICVHKDSDINPYKIAAKLKKLELTWGKSSEKNWHRYLINIRQQQTVDVINVFLQYLP